MRMGASGAEPFEGKFRRAEKLGGEVKSWPWNCRWPWSRTEVDLGVRPQGKVTGAPEIVVAVIVLAQPEVFPEEVSILDHSSEEAVEELV